MPTVFDSDGKAAYVYNVADDTWYQVSGKTDISGTFEWTGLHTHLSNLTAAENFTAKKGINNFLNPSARDAGITSPTAGIICLIRQDGSGNTINQLQFYSGSAWVPFIPVQTGNANKFLQTDGIITQWREIPDPFPVAFMMMGVGY
jgi:hypothetical protein